MTPDAHEPTRGMRLLAEATDALRVHTPSGWRAVRADLLELARNAHRSSVPVRGEHELGEFLLAGDVVSAGLRAAVDGVPDATATSVSLRTDTEHRVEKVTVEVAALFGAHLPTTAAQVRRAVTAQLADLLGDLSPGEGGVDVHVHVGDVLVDVTAVANPALPSTAPD